MTYNSSACILYSQNLRHCALPSYEPAVLAKDNFEKSNYSIHSG